MSVSEIALCDYSIFDRFGQLRGKVDSHTNANRDPDANSETHSDTNTNRDPDANRHARSNCNPDTIGDTDPNAKSDTPASANASPATNAEVSRDSFMLCDRYQGGTRCPQRVGRMNAAVPPVYLRLRRIFGHRLQRSRSTDFLQTTKLFRAHRFPQRS